jgi:hypothetical protein
MLPPEHRASVVPRFSNILRFLVLVATMRVPFRLREVGQL